MSEDSQKQEKEREVKKVVIKENGQVNIDEGFNRVLLLGLLEYELAHQRAIVEEQKKLDIRDTINTLKNSNKEEIVENG